MLGPVSLCGPPAPNCNRNITANCPYVLPFAKIASWTALSTDEDEIASALYTQGPLSVLLDASQLQYYQSGIWNGHIDAMPVGCHNTTLNHAVLLVGYGVSEEGVKYWIVKNSWGVNYGEDGYFRIERGVGMCGINTAVTTSHV
jgi:C1A family cysteine protease